MKKILLIIAILFPTNILAIEFTGKFIQGHYILGKTDPGSQILIDKKTVARCRIALGQHWKRKVTISW